MSDRTGLISLASTSARVSRFPQIVRLLRDHGITEISRELPYHDLAYATSANWLTYSPPPHIRWTEQLLSNYPFLKEAMIPKDGERMAVIAESARVISRSIYEIADRLARKYGTSWQFPEYSTTQEILRDRDFPAESRPPRRKGDRSENAGTFAGQSPDPNPMPLVIEIRIGVSGGRTLGATIKELGRILVQEIEDEERKLKKAVWEAISEEGATAPKPDARLWRRFRVELRLLFINLVSGFDTDPFNHPIAYVTAMINSDDLLVSRAEMMCFCATPFVKIGESDDVENMPESPARVKKFVEKHGFDIIVTSAGCIDDQHTTLNFYYGGGEVPRRILEGHGVEGDFLWMPVTARGAFNYEKELTPGEAALLKDPADDAPQPG